MVRRAFDAVHWYMEEIGAQLVAKTGIPSDRHHIGKLILQGLKDDPNFISQIDGATGESETNGSVLDRSIRCAISLRQLGLKTGDVMVLMGPNHLDFCIPHNAALYLGIMVACIDATLNVNELKDLFQANRPKIIFGQSERTSGIKNALTLAEVDAQIMTFNKGSDYTTLAQLLEIPDEKAVKDFQATDFNPSETVCYLTSTSGTTGVPKTAMLTHKNMATGTPSLWYFI
uniref:AMP-dependent synthetase/ligase domain-containing protein n=1 Tax=Heliothis virescens TaxID=7102 RepID=A0A2A4JGC8_HELVI